jgi:membrane protein implicated in regulation of membrane protease activity
MRPFTRYLLLELPGWVIAAVVLAWLWPLGGLDPWLGAGVFALWVAKDLAVYPFLRIAYEPGRTGVEQLVGLRGVVSRAVDPVGYVRLRGERWRAELAPGERPIPAGVEVEVRSAEGLTLRVARVDGA